MDIKIRVRCPSESFVLNVKSTTTVSEFLNLIHKKTQIGIDSFELRFGSKGRYSGVFPTDNKYATLGQLGYLNDPHFVLHKLKESVWKPLTSSAFTSTLGTPDVNGLKAHPSERFLEQEKFYKAAHKADVTGVNNTMSAPKGSGIGFRRDIDIIKQLISIPGGFTNELNINDKKHISPQDKSYVSNQRKKQRVQKKQKHDYQKKAKHSKRYSESRSRSKKTKKKKYQPNSRGSRKKNHRSVDRRSMRRQSARCHSPRVTKKKRYKPQKRKKETKKKCTGPTNHNNSSDDNSSDDNSSDDNSSDDNSSDDNSSDKRSHVTKRNKNDRKKWYKSKDKRQTRSTHSMTSDSDSHTNSGRSSKRIKKGDLKKNRKSKTERHKKNIYDIRSTRNKKEKQLSKHKREQYSPASSIRSRNSKNGERRKILKQDEDNNGKNGESRMYTDRRSDYLKGKMRTSVIRSKLKKTSDDKVTTVSSVMKMKMAANLKHRLSVAVQKDLSLTDTIQVAQKLQRQFREKLVREQKQVTYQQHVEEQIKTANARSVVMAIVEDDDQKEKILDFKKTIHQQQNYLTTKRDVCHFDAIFGKSTMNIEKTLEQPVRKTALGIEHRKTNSNWRERVQRMRKIEERKKFHAQTEEYNESDSSGNN